MENRYKGKDWNRDGGKLTYESFMADYRKYLKIAEDKGCPDDVRKGCLRRSKDAFARAMSIRVAYGV